MYWSVVVPGARANEYIFQDEELTRQPCHIIISQPGCLSVQRDAIHPHHPPAAPIMCLIWAGRPRRVVVVDLVFVAAAAAVVLVLVANWNLSTTTCSRNHLSRHIVKGDLTHISLALK